MNPLPTVAALVAAVLIVIVGIGLINDAGDASSAWGYDEYRPAEGVSSASGALELVSVGGVEYVHAKALGGGEVTYEDGTSEQVTVRKGVLDLFLFAGQSNAAYSQVPGSVDPSSASPVPVPGTGYYFGLESRYDRLFDSTTPIFRSLTDSDGGSAIGDKAPSFAASYNEATGSRVYFVCVAISGQSISNMDPNGGAGWDYAVRVVSAALEAVDDDLFILNPRGYIWIQGESDVSMSAEEYAGRFDEMNSRIQSGGWGIPMDHCFVSKLNSSYASAGSVLGMDMVVASDASVTYAASAWDFSISDGTMCDDGIHYTQAGDNIIGSELGTSCAEWYGPPDIGPTMQIIGVIPVLLAVSVVAFVVVSFARRY